MRTQVLMAAVGLALTGFGAGYPTDLIYYSKLDSAADITSPQVGAAGTIGTATFQTGKSGNALLVPVNSILASIPFANGLGNKFCIEFDVKILSGNANFESVDPYMFAFRDKSSKVVFEAQFNGNDGDGRSGFGFGAPYSAAIFVSCSGLYGLYSEILGENPKDWHHYKLLWNANGLNGTANTLAAYIDGALKASGQSDATQISTFATKMNQALTFEFGRSESKSPFLIDEFKVWKTDTPSGDIPPVELPVVSEVTAKQHYPWCGKVDIGYTVAGSTDGLLVKISVKDNDNNVIYEAKTFDVKPTAAAGAHTVVWDATKDGVNKVSKNMVATVSLIVPEN